MKSNIFAVVLAAFLLVPTFASAEYTNSYRYSDLEDGTLYYNLESLGVTSNGQYAWKVTSRYGEFTQRGDRDLVTGTSNQTIGLWSDNETHTMVHIPQGGSGVVYTSGSKLWIGGGNKRWDAARGSWRPVNGTISATANNNPYTHDLNAIAGGNYNATLSDEVLARSLITERSERVAAGGVLAGGLLNERTERIAGDRTVAGLVDDEAATRSAGDARLGAALGTERDTRIHNDRVLGGLIADEAGARVAGDRAVSTYAEDLTEAEEIARIEADLAEASARYEADLAEAKARIAAIATEKAERQADNVAQDKAVAADQYRQDVAIQNNYNTNVRQDAAISGNTTRIQNLESDVRGLEGGVALGIAAASHHYDGGYQGVQASLAAGYYEGASAMSLGLGGNIGKRTFLNANVGTTSRGSAGVGAAIGWKF